MTEPAARALLVVFLIGLACVGGGAPADAAQSTIRWRVENPFRFFTDPADAEIHRATYRALGPEEKASPVLSAERALQRRHDDGWAATMFGKICWDGAKNRYGCSAYDDYMNPIGHRIVAEVAGIEDAANLTCTWSTSGSPRGEEHPQPCNESAAFEIPYPEGAKLAVSIGGVEVARTEVKVRDLLVAAAGDSFGSGEGNPDVPVRFSRDRASDYGKSLLSDGLSGFPARIGDWRSIGDKKFIRENARWTDQACHRSLYSHQLRAALQLSVEDPHRAVTFVGLACSGAEVTFGLFLRYKGNEWVPNPPALSQISAIAEAQCGKRDTEALDLPEAYHINGTIPELKGGLVLRKCPQKNARKIDLVMLSVGGNDIGFSRLVANAVLSNESTLRQLGGWIGEVHGQADADAQLSRLDAKYKSLNRAVHSLLYVPWEESDRIILVGYPGLALAGDGSETCKDSRAGMEIVADFELREQKLREGAWIADKLHREMRSSAGLYGWTFVETHRRAFINRGICSGASDDGANIYDDLRIPRKVDGVWKPYNPADYRAYASRQRWFRTPNDAFMTGNFHVAQSVLQKVLKLDALASFQLLLAATYSGAFHPTAEGHAAIADSVAEKARVVLQKYGQGPEAETDFQEPDIVAPVDEPGVAMPDVKLQAPAAEAAKSEAPKPDAPSTSEQPPRGVERQASPAESEPASRSASEEEPPRPEADRKPSEPSDAWSADARPADAQSPGPTTDETGRERAAPAAGGRRPFAPPSGIVAGPDAAKAVQNP